ncbi:hypothetical protein BDV06DRAFT_183171 [Aspergillus oleicola]
MVSAISIYPLVVALVWSTSISSSTREHEHIRQPKFAQCSFRRQLFDEISTTLASKAPTQRHRAITIHQLSTLWRDRFLRYATPEIFRPHEWLISPEPGLRVFQLDDTTAGIQAKCFSTGASHA